MSIHGNLAFTNWVVGVLEAGGLTVGRSHKPAGATVNDGYVVVYPLAGGITYGTLEAPRSDAEPDIQVSAIHVAEERALWLIDRARTLIDAAVPAPLSDGRHVIWLDFPMASIQIRRDDDVQPPVFVAIDRYSCGTST